MDELEAKYFSELLPDETWEEYDRRHKISINHIDLVADMLADYYEQEEAD